MSGAERTPRNLHRDPFESLAEYVYAVYMQVETP